MLKNHIKFLLASGLLVGLVGLWLLAGTAGASPRLQDATPTVTPEATAPPKACVECHPDKQDAWLESPHAMSFDDPVFQEGWANMEHSEDCLLCHKATYDEASNTYIGEGVSCEACHGQGSVEHPPEDIPVLSDEEYCGTCHPTTLGEARLSGHSTENEVRCVDCHDPHSQKVLAENPDAICKNCHDAEDLGKMEASLGQLHLQENIPCADCHTLDVPHTFLFNFQHEDTAAFFKGFDCASEITESVASRAGTSHEVLGSYVKDQMNWPVVHRVSRLESAPLCSDCHVMDEKLRADFAALGYTIEEVDDLSWESEDFPPLNETDLAKLVATPRRSWSWLYWLVGVIAVFGIFEFSVARKMNGGAQVSLKEYLSSVFRRKPAKDEKKDDQRGEEK
jgi:predicted CXXCH cytochrome family protein